jgi:tRNA (guanine37-N1)-methyltransferase
MGLTITVFTLFPEMLHPLIEASVLGRAVKKGLLNYKLVNIRDFTRDKHKTADDRPYGGGCGMVMKIEPIARAIHSARREQKIEKIFCLAPSGRRFSQALAKELAGQKSFGLLCGHYEGIDQRVIDHLCDGEISIGDYILTGGEVAAAVIIDAVSRLVPGVLGDSESVVCESFEESLLDFPHYTRPATYRGWKVPEVITKGNHAAVAAWRREQQLRRTMLARPDLLENAALSKQDLSFLEKIKTKSPSNSKAGG